jgi:hypothetical protein
MTKTDRPDTWLTMLAARLQLGRCPDMQTTLKPTLRGI